MSADNNNSKDLNILKTNLEVDKLIYENKTSTRIFSWLLKGFPSILGIGSIIYLMISGILNQQKLINEKRRENLVFDINKFEKTRDSLKVENESIKFENHLLKNSSDSLVSASKELNSQISFLNQTKSSLMKSFENESIKNKSLIKTNLALYDSNLAIKKTLFLTNDQIYGMRMELVSRAADCEHDLRFYMAEAKKYMDKYGDLLNKQDQSNK